MSEIIPPFVYRWFLIKMDVFNHDECAFMYIFALPLLMQYMCVSNFETEGVCTGNMKKKKTTSRSAKQTSYVFLKINVKYIDTIHSITLFQCLK